MDSFLREHYKTVNRAFGIGAFLLVAYSVLLTVISPLVMPLFADALDATDPALMDEYNALVANPSTHAIGAAISVMIIAFGILVLLNRYLAVIPLGIHVILTVVNQILNAEYFRALFAGDPTIVVVLPFLMPIVPFAWLTLLKVRGHIV